MSIWQTLFSSGKTIEKVGDGIYNGIDKAFYTDEEKALDNQKLIKIKMDMLKAYEPFKIAQRLLALVTAIPFVLIHLLITVTYILCIVLMEPGDGLTYILTELKALAGVNNSTLGEVVGYLFIFYFLGGAGEGIVRRFKKS